MSTSCGIKGAGYFSIDRGKNQGVFNRFANPPKDIAFSARKRGVFVDKRFARQNALQSGIFFGK